MKNTDLQSLLARKGVLVSDGATGTNLQKMGLPVGKAPEHWVLEKPDLVKQLYSDFIDAGSDIILTCTFGGNRIRLSHSGLEDKLEEINRTAVDLAKSAVHGKEVFVAGSIGPTGEMMEPYGTLTEDAAFDIYLQQAAILIDAGIDLLVIETQYDLTEARKGIQAVRSLSDIALICSFSYDRGTKTMMGVDPQKAIQSLKDEDIFAIGVNCGKSIESNVKVLQTISDLTDKPIWFKPNAGSPETDASGNMHYHITPEDMGSQVKNWIELGAKFIGGCCGTSPEHLAAIKANIS